MSITYIVEARPEGHRLQHVAHIAKVACASGPVIWLTSHGITESAEFRTHLGGLELTVSEAFAGERPSPREIARQLAALQLAREDLVLIPEADQLIKSWWWALPAAFPRRRTRPRTVLLFIQHPTLVRWNDRRGWAKRVAKFSLSLLTLARGAAERIYRLTPAGDTSSGRILRPLRDPALCSKRHSDRDALREQLGLPVHAKLVAVLGFIDTRKNVPLVGAAVFALPADVFLLLAGRLSAEVDGWLASLSPDQRRRMIARPGHLTDDELDSYAAAADVITVAHSYNGPSGFMGKAIATGTGVLTAGSPVQARDARCWSNAVAAKLTEDGIREGLRHLLDHRPPGGAWSVPDGLPDGEYYARTLLGGSLSERTPMPAS